MYLIIINCILSCVMINWSIFSNWTSGSLYFLGFLLETLCSSQFCEFELQIELNFTALEHASWHLTIHASYSFLLFYIYIYIYIFFFMLTCNLPLIFFILLCVFVLILALCLGRLEPIGPPPLPLTLPLGVSCLGMQKQRGLWETEL